MKTQSMPGATNGWLRGRAAGAGVAFATALLVGSGASGEAKGPAAKPPAPAPKAAKAAAAAPAPAAADGPCGLADGVHKGDGAALRAAIEAALRAPELSKAKVAVAVKNVVTGETLFEKDASLALHPASNMKVLTSAAALHHLGPAYRFSTTVYYDAEKLLDGRLDGPLYVKGGGDPGLVTEEMHKIADEIALSSLREVAGGIVIDQSFFDAALLAPGFEEEPGEDRAFRATSSAAALNFNSVGIDFRPSPLGAGAPALVRAVPDTAYVRVDAAVATVEAGKPAKVRVTCSKDKDRDKCVVRGTVAAGTEPDRAYKRVSNPSVYLGTVLGEMLGARGIKVSGKVRDGATPGGLPELYRHRSDQLGVIVRDINKVSNNFMAEQLLRTLGAEIGGAGSWAAGVGVVRDYLVGLGIAPDAFRLVNGSGLFGDTRVAPAHFVRVLESAARDFRIAPDFVASLAIAATDGTIRGRMSECAAADVLRAKTGTLDNVTALSGYVAAPDGGLVAFSILMNDVPTGTLSKVWKVQDQIGAAIASYLALPKFAHSSPKF